MLASGTTLLSVIFFAVMSWAAARHFRRDGTVPARMRAVSVLCLLLMVCVLWQRRSVVLGDAGVAPWREAISFVFTSVALGLMCWAIRATRRQRLTLAFSTDLPSFLVRSGPYALVRHPFYAAYIAFWFATAAGSPDPLYWLAAILLGGIYWERARSEEQKFGRSAIAACYRAYRAQTGMFLPRWRPGT